MSGSPSTGMRSGSLHLCRRRRDRRTAPRAQSRSHQGLPAPGPSARAPAQEALDGTRSRPQDWPQTTRRAPARTPSHSPRRGPEMQRGPAKPVNGVAGHHIRSGGTPQTCDSPVDHRHSPAAFDACQGTAPTDRSSCVWSPASQSTAATATAEIPPESASSPPDRRNSDWARVSPSRPKRGSHSGLAEAARSPAGGSMAHGRPLPNGGSFDAPACQRCP